MSDAELEAELTSIAERICADKGIAYSDAFRRDLGKIMDWLEEHNGDLSALKW